MKLIALKVFKYYLNIGLVFGLINQISWLYSSFATLYYEFPTVFSFAGILPFLWSFFIHIIFEPIIRVFLWLPSILSLLSPEIDISFMYWLAPGFYEMLISNG